MGEAHEVEEFGHAFLGLAAAHAAGQTKRDVLSNGAPRQETWFLKGDGGGIVVGTDGLAVQCDG